MDEHLIATIEIQLTYADTDMMGVIYHANYLKWFELGRCQLVRDAGYDYLDMEKEGYYAPVYNVDVTYKKAVRYGDRIFVNCWVEENQGLWTVYGYQVINNDREVCAEGTTKHILVRKDNFKPVQFKKLFPEWFQRYEAIKKK